MNYKEIYQKVINFITSKDSEVLEVFKNKDVRGGFWLGVIVGVVLTIFISSVYK